MINHAKHVDGEFCTATIAYLEELSPCLGPNEVCFCRLSIGLTAAKQQSALVIHVAHRVMRVPC